MIQDKKKNKKISNSDRGLTSILIEFKPLSGKRGYAVMELLFYISFFVVLSLVVISAMITMARAFRETAIQAELVQSGNIVERMSREIRAASNINSITANDLVLQTKDQNGADEILEFSLSGSDVQLLENDVLTGNLNTPNIAVTALSFTQITTAQGKAVRIVLTVRSNGDVSGTTQNFYNTIVLRGTYK